MEEQVGELTSVDSQQSEQINTGEIQDKTSGARVEPKEEYVLDKDPRFKTVWGKDPNKVYKSYKELEKVYTPTQQILKKYGIDKPENLGKIFEEHKYYTNPESELQKFLRRIAPLMQSQEDQAAFEKWIADKEKAIRYRDIDQNLPPEIKEQLAAAREAKEEVRNLKEEIEIKEITKEIQDNLAEIEKYAKEHNLPLDKNQFIADCNRDDVPAKQMMHYFRSHALDSVVKNASRKSEENVLENLEKTKVGGLVSGDQKSAPRKKAGSFEQQLDAALGIE